MSFVSVERTQQVKPGSNNKFHLGVGERKLPRPIVFWSDKERDAFRRNKIVHTQYCILLDDIETQKRFSKRNIRFEAHKFRQRSAKYLDDSQRNISDVCSTYSSELGFSPRNKLPQDEDSLSEMSSITDDKEDCDVWSKAKKSVVSQNKKTTVKFSVYKEIIPNDNYLKMKINSSAGGSRLNSTKDVKLRSLSASNTRQVPELPVLNNNSQRSKSVFPNVINSSENFQRQNGEYLRKCSTPVDQDKTQERNKVFVQSKFYFDRSQAAYQLRRELQRLARLRKRGIITPSFSVEHALKEEKLKFDASQSKVNDYLQKLDLEKSNDFLK